MKLKSTSHLTKLTPVCGLAVLLSMSAHGATNFVWNAATAMLYDTNYVNDPTSAANVQFQLNNSAGSLTLNNGTLLLTNTTWGAFVGQNSLGAITNNGGTLRWYATGANEQRFAIGNGPNNGTGRGTVVMNGGTFEIFTEGGTDTQRNWAVGRDSGTGTLIVNNGIIWGHTDRVTFGGQFNANGSFTANATGVVTLGLGNGIFRLTGLTDLSTASLNFNPNGNSYINFVLGSQGQIQIQNATQADYENWVNNGWMRLNGQVTTVNALSYTNDGTYGILKLVGLAATTPVFSPTNVVYAGEAVTASVTALGSGTLAYQWQTDGALATFTNIPGATSTNVAIDTTSLSGANLYRIIVNSGGNSFTSAPATLTVNAASAPFLTADTTPAGPLSRYVGGTISFTAAFDGNHPISYQWELDGGSGYTNVPGATSATLTTTNLQFDHAGSYRLSAVNSQGTTTSTPAVLTVLDPAGLQFIWSAPVPFNGLNADQILTNVSGGATGIVGAAVFGNTAPLAVTLSGGRVVTFKNDGSTATSTGLGVASGAYPVGTTNTTGNANFDSVLNQFRPDGGPHLITLNGLIPGERYAVQLFAVDNRGDGTVGAISNRLCNFQDGDDAAISVETTATYKMGDNVYVVGTFYASNTTETILQNLPTSNNGNINALVLRALSFTPAGQLPVVLVNPASVSTFAGHTAQFAVAAESYVTPTYQWQAGPVGGPYTNVSNGATYSGATTTNLTVLNVTGLNGVEFLCNVSNPEGTTPSATAALTVLAVPGASGLGASAVLTLNPVAYWPLNENFDVSGGGVPAYEAISGKDAAYGVASLNGFNSIVGPQATDGYPQFAPGQGALSPTASTANSWVTTPALNLNTNTITISMWVYPNGIQAGFAGLFMNRNAGSIGGLHVGNNNELRYTWVENTATTWGHATGLILPQNVWSYVALVTTATNTTWYLYNTNSGLLTHTYTINNTNMPWTGNSSLIRIGCDNSVGRTFNGVIDEVALFNRSLTQAEVMQLATAAPTVTITSAGANLQVTWPFGTLLQADSVSGPWTTNVNSSPYIFAPIGAQKFFRVQTQ